MEFKDLVEIEILLLVFSHKNGFGFLTEEDKVALIKLESRKRKILLDREHEARQKSRAIWLLCGDDNTPFFHKFANQRKNTNSIWKIKDDGGNMVEGFALEKISTQNGPFNFYSNSMSSCVSQ